MAESGDGEHQDTVDLCHFADGAYEAADAPESDFYGPDAQGHGRDGQDIVPPFVIEDPRPDDPSSFDGRNWDDRGQAILDAGWRRRAADRSRGRPPSRRRRSGSATRRARRRIPTRSNEPAIANNGDLNGGHLNHTGPVYPADGWGDIIPPYQYVDKDGKLQTFPGYNWSEAGQAIYENGCEPPVPPTPKKVVPILECVEQLDRGSYLAHWGYENKNDTTVEATGDQNTFSPAPANRGQPTAFAAGRVEDPSRSSSTAPSSPGRSPGTRRPPAGTRRSAPAARSRSRSGSSPRTTPAASPCGSTARSPAAPRPSATAGRRARSPSRRAAAR